MLNTFGISEERSLFISQKAWLNDLWLLPEKCQQTFTQPREDTHVKPKKQFYRRLAQWNSALTGFTYCSMGHSRQQHHRKVYPSTTEVSQKLHPNSSLLAQPAGTGFSLWLKSSMALTLRQGKMWEPKQRMVTQKDGGRYGGGRGSKRGGKLSRTHLQWPPMTYFFPPSHNHITSSMAM